MTLKNKLLLLGLLSLGLSAKAQLPCETVLLVNTNSQDSLKVAANFALMRHMPQQNIIHIGLDETQHEISSEQFTEQVWEPVQKELKARGLEHHVLAWIYSAGFPYRIRTSSDKMSITGITWTRNIVPEKKQVGPVSTAVYFSPLFRGPGDNPKIPVQGSGSLDRFNKGLGDKMPIPAMMLGYTGKNGNTVDEVLASLENGIKGDHTHPDSGVYFIKTDDQYRSFPREWEFGPAQLELAERSIEATTMTGLQIDKENVWGLLTGRWKLPSDNLPTFVPGAMADHMSSFAAKFDDDVQSKCTDWIRAGATATAGTVTEPYSIWWKFPHARFFTHYSRGCTMLESFAQSLLNPAQTLLVGEPFCRPWRAKFDVGLVGLPQTPISEKATITAICKPKITGQTMNYAFFIDGKSVCTESASPSYRIDPTTLSDGYHELCILAKIDVAVTQGAQAVGGFMVNLKNRTPKITGLKELGEQEIAVPFEVAADQSPVNVLLYSGSRLLAEKEYDSETQLSFNEKTVGEGPHTVQVAARYADGTESRSLPVPFKIAFAVEPVEETPAEPAAEPAAE